MLLLGGKFLYKPARVIKSCKSKDRQYNDQEKKNKRTMIYLTLHSKLKIEQHEPH